MSLSEDAPGLTVRCITEKPKDMDPSMTSEWKILHVLWHTQPTHFYYCKRKLNSLVLLFIYIIYLKSIFKWNSSETSGGDNWEKPLFLSSDGISNPRSSQLDVSRSPDELLEIIRNVFDTEVEQGGLRRGFFWGGRSV